MKVRLYYLVILAVFFSCNQDKPTTLGSEQINIRLAKDPKQINPVLSPTSLAREVSQYIFLPLADYHPESLELCPILCTEIPKAYQKTINGEELVGYDIQIKKDAVWTDGTPVTNKDYAYTIKMVNHTGSNAVGWRPYFNLMKSIVLDANDEKRFSVYFDKDYMLSLETAITPQILPAHVYDPQGIFQRMTLSELKEEGYKPKDSIEINLLAEINQSVHQKENVVQSGPYSLTNYESDQYYLLSRKENYWGENYPDNPFLQAYPNKITFKIVPDEVTAITMAKEGKIDLMNMKDSNAFLSMKEDESMNSEWGFHVPQLMRFYYIGMNNRTEILKDKRVRNALSHITDIDDIIENIDGGLGIRTTGPFHPSKSYYNNALQPLEYDLEVASKLLDEAGWIDTDNDKVRDKVINGVRTPLDLDILITGSALSKNISLLLQEAGAKIGVKINLVSKKWSLIKKENLENFNFDLAMLVIITDEAPDDPYGRWHSDNMVVGKMNVVGYHNPEVDALIETLRKTIDPKARKEIYFDIQKRMYDDQPVIFLYCPLNKTIINNKFSAVTTAKRPGYMANTFKMN